MNLAAVLMDQSMGMSVKARPRGVVGAAAAAAAAARFSASFFSRERWSCPDAAPVNLTLPRRLMAPAETRGGALVSSSSPFTVATSANVRTPPRPRAGLSLDPPPRRRLPRSPDGFRDVVVPPVPLSPPRSLSSSAGLRLGGASAASPAERLFPAAMPPTSALSYDARSKIQMDLAVWGCPKSDLSVRSAKDALPSVATCRARSRS